MLFKEYLALKKQLWEGRLWNPSYFIATVGGNIEARIREHIRGQSWDEANGSKLRDKTISG